MKMHNPWWRLGAVAAGMLLVAGSLTGCANWFDGGGGGGSSAATTSSVADSLNQKFNNIDRDLTLWNIQPGLGTIMIEYGKRFFMIRHAVDAGDWGMASYQLKEQLEIQEVGEVTRSTHAAALKSFESNYLDPISQDIQNKDATSFATDFAKAISGCNGCHVATGHPYVVVQPATLVPEVNVDFGSSEPVAPSGESTFTDPELPFALDKTLTGSEVGDLIDFYFNNLNRNLALWNIQPGLGTVMIEYAMRFAMANYAAQADNWGMAQYQIKEAREIQEVGEFTRPQFAAGLKSFETTYLDPLDEAILNEDIDAFDTAYANAITGCNGCHAANNHAFVQVMMPTRNPEPILALSASSAGTPEESSTFSTDAPTIPDNPSIADAQTAIDYRLNHIDRNLALWNLQPGLGTVMIEYGHRMGLVWAAAEAGDWGMAAYQLKEALEIQETGEVTRSSHAAALKTFESTYLDPLSTDIDSQDTTSFETDFAAAITGCNGCHTATGHAYITVQVPTSAPDFLLLGSSDAGQAKFTSACAGCHTDASVPAAARDQITNDMGTVNSAMSGITLTDQEVADLKIYLGSL